VGFPCTPQCDVAKSPLFLSASATLSETERVFYVTMRLGWKMLQRWRGGGWRLSLGNHITKRRRERRILRNREDESWLATCMESFFKTNTGTLQWNNLQV
jgi:hypothetical protein